MKYSFLLCLPAFCALSLLWPGCTYDNNAELHPVTPGCDTTGVMSFATDVQPILVGHCGTDNPACHAEIGASSYPLNIYEGVKLVVDNSKLVSAIWHDGNASPMPQGAPQLDSCLLLTITRWVEQGALNN